MSLARRISLALSVVALAACAGRTPRPSVAAAAAERREPGPLAARLLPPFHRELNFVLSERAYVAIFEIVPGRGVSVVYPAPFDVGATQPLGPGSHTVFAVPLNVGRWFYSDMPGAIASTRPTFLYMIASREPLPIDDVLRNPVSLRRTVGFANFTQANEQRTMDALDERFVPRSLDDEEWTSDWIALWPEPALDHPPVDARRRLPSCHDGMAVVAIPGPTPAYVCTPRASKQPPTPRVPPDSTASPEPPRTPPTGATPAPPPPANGRRPNAPKRTRSEPLSLAVDYGAPTSPDDREGRDPRQPAARRAGRPWERAERTTSLDRDAHPGAGRYEGYDGFGMRGVRDDGRRGWSAVQNQRPSASHAERTDAERAPSTRTGTRTQNHPASSPAAAAPRGASGSQ